MVHLYKNAQAYEWLFCPRQGQCQRVAWSVMSTLYLANCLVLASGTEAESSIARVNTPGMIIPDDPEVGYRDHSRSKTVR